jgi:cell division septum initiation protein DivIVA
MANIFDEFADFLMKTQQQFNQLLQEKRALEQENKILQEQLKSIRLSDPMKGKD